MPNWSPTSPPERGRTLLLTDVRTIGPSARSAGTWVLFDSDTITGVGTGKPPHADEVVSGGGRRIIPGFIDLHCHGGGGRSFDGTRDDIKAALAVHRAQGTTRSVLSLVSAPIEDLVDSLRIIAALDDPLVLGAHLEGPFLAPTRRGAHDAAALMAPTPAAVEQLLEAADGCLRQITLAPELPGALDTIERFTREGVVCAVGHTEADADVTRAAIDRGARLITHAFNAMPGLHHRSPGPLGVALTDERLTLELIVDGAHVHPDVVRMAFIAAPGRMALVSDAMAGAGCCDGSYTLGSLPVQVHEGAATLEDGTLAGSILTLDAALRIAVEQCQLPLPAVVDALTSVPAKVLGLDTQLGRLAPGFAADVVLLDDDGGVAAVYAAGVLVQHGRTSLVGERTPPSRTIGVLG